MNYETILEAYSIEQLLELNDKTPAEMLEFLVENEFIRMPLVFDND